MKRKNQQTRPQEKNKTSDGRVLPAGGAKLLSEEGGHWGKLRWTWRPPSGDAPRRATPPANDWKGFSGASYKSESATWRPPQGIAGSDSTCSWYFETLAVLFVNFYYNFTDTISIFSFLFFDNTKWKCAKDGKTKNKTNVKISKNKKKMPVNRRRHLGHC